MTGREPISSLAWQGSDRLSEGDHFCGQRVPLIINVLGKRFVHNVDNCNDETFTRYVKRQRKSSVNCPC